MTPTTAIWIYLVILTGYFIWLRIRVSDRLDRIRAGFEGLAFDNTQHKLDIKQRDRYLRGMEGENDYRGLSLRIYECEGKLQDVALLFDHLALEIQEPTTTTTPRRLVTKGKGGKK